ncbi:MAG: type III secretion system needle subunit protein SctF [Waddliaceae bacterium]|nr:type III secretion system needle subunit protein SctF [Waddliaceae bacterium]
MTNRSGFSMENLLVNIVQNAVTSARDKLNEIKIQGSSISIGNMFEMQMLMNRLSQFSEMSTSVVSASNTAIGSIARNIK